MKCAVPINCFWKVFKCSEFPKTFVDISDPKVCDIKNYDINSVEICGAHKCPGIEPDENKVEYKLIKVTNNRGNPNFHFEINGKYYVYGFRGIKRDYKIVFACIKSICHTYASITASEFLKEIIQNSPENSKYPKFLDRSDPKVYVWQNYEINSLEFYGAHKCPGIEPGHNEPKYKLV